MEEYAIVTRTQSSELEQKLQELADACREGGEIQTFLVAMAAILQREMTDHRNLGKLPYDAPIDNIMRAVEHTLRGDPSMDAYVLEKLGFGHQCLESWMKKPSKSPVMA